MNEYKPTITIKASDFPELVFNVDDEGSMVVNFKVVGVNKDTFEDLGEKSYTLEYTVEKLTKDQVSLSQAAERASKNNEVRVVPRVQNAP